MFPHLQKDFVFNNFDYIEYIELKEEEKYYLDSNVRYLLKINMFLTLDVRITLLLQDD